MMHLNQGFADGGGALRDVFQLGDARAQNSAPSSQKLQSLLTSFEFLDGRLRAILGRDGAYFSGSAGMDDILEMGDCMKLENGLVCASAAEQAASWRDFLNVEAPEVRTLTLPCSEIDGHLLLRATSVCETALVMSVQRASQMTEPELADLEQVFHLTKTEAAIVYDLFLGWTPQKIAEDHDNSIHTIRAHIRRCYDKMGITCREELWRKLNAYRLV